MHNYIKIDRAGSEPVDLYFKDWGEGKSDRVQPRPGRCSADDWDTQMLFRNRGFRVIAHDRRGHGRSTQTDGRPSTWTTTPTTSAALTEQLDLKDAVHVGHSTGGGEVVHYIARHGESRVAKAVIISVGAVR